MLLDSACIYIAGIHHVSLNGHCPTNTTGITIFIVYFSMSVQIGFEKGHFPANIARVFTLFLSVNFLVILQYSRWLERFIIDIAFMSEFFVFTFHVSIKVYFYTKFLSTCLTFIWFGFFEMFVIISLQIHVTEEYHFTIWTTKWTLKYMTSFMLWPWGLILKE